MSSKQYCKYVEKRSVRRKNGEFPEAHHRMPDGKLVETVQICLRCGKKFSFKRGRKRCPCCLCLLRTKIVVLNLP